MRALSINFPRQSLCSMVTRVGSLRHLTSTTLDQFVVVNEPMRRYLPGSADRLQLDERLTFYKDTCTNIPIVIDDEEIHTADVRFQVMPFDFKKRVAKFCYADKSLLMRAIESSVRAQKKWDVVPYEKRAQVFLNAAKLIQDKYRMDLMATTMLGQGKTIVQAEIDATCELIDFLQFNVQFGWAATRYQPVSKDPIRNTMIYRGMEGFWASISPFNFTAIGGNLSSAPALAGNAVLWKPSDTAMLSNYTIYKIFREAGLPAGVINFVPADGPTFGTSVTQSQDLAGINFTGSVGTFEYLWKQVGQNISNYEGFPRLIGECGGKNFHLVHSSADVVSVVNGTLRSAFEYSGQKCSACSRLYLPKSLAPDILGRLTSALKEVKVGSPLETGTFLSAVIDDKSFARIQSYQEHARNSPDCEILAGGGADGSVGYYVQPTIVLCRNKNDKLLKEEIFGPILSVYVYEEAEIDDLVTHIDKSTRYGLTGSIFSRDQRVLDEWSRRLRFAAGNFYVNDKSTGAVVGQQPFGGARKSGTNDKAGGPHYLLRFMSPQAIKTNSARLEQWSYPSV